MTNNPTTTTTTTPPPPAYDAVAAISNTTKTTTTTPDDDGSVGLDDDAKKNHIKRDTADDDDDDDSLASLTTRELHRIAIPNGDRLGEVSKVSAGGGAGNLDNNEGGGLSEAEEKDAKIALCEVRNPKKIGQGTSNNILTTKINDFDDECISSVKHVLHFRFRRNASSSDKKLCTIIIIIIIIIKQA